MKKPVKTILSLVLAAAVLLAAAWAVLTFVFDANPFDPSGWKTRDGNTYYRDEKGNPLLGWQEIEGSFYYFDPNQAGAMATGWLDTGSGRVYLGENGARHSGWLTLEDGTYYCGSGGIAHTGWLEEQGQQHYFDAQGKMVTGWLEEGGTRYFLNADGTPYTGWLEDGGKRYLLGPEGSIITGWIETPEGRFYLDNTTGAISTGWLDTEDGRYYLKEDGTMAIGEVEIDGISRFFTSSGKYVVLTNKWHPVPEDYEVELVSYGKHRISQECVEQLKAMIKEVSPLGYCKVTNVYRSRESQQAIWDRRVGNYLASGYSQEEAEEEVSKSVAIPGTSEHQLGLSADIDGVKPVHEWLAEHCWEYGFIVRYPEGKADITGILYEPWHFRYVGVELAKELYDLGLTMEEYMDMLTAQNS